jgi:hypothetical protein
MNALRKFPHANSVYPFGEFLHYTDVRPAFSAAEIEGYLKNEGLQNIAIHPIPPQIEDSFMELMKKHDDE